MLPSVSEISFRRKKLGLTQSGLAKAAGVSQSLVAKIEAGRTDASYSNVKKIFDALEASESESERKAKDVMSAKIFSVAKEDSVQKAVKLMQERKISQLPVLDIGTCVGSVSEKSVLDRMTNGSSRNVREMSVEDAMEEAFPTVGENAPLSALNALLHHHLAVMVQKKGKIVGIITKSDLLK